MSCPQISSVLGYQVAQASIATRGLFERCVGEPLGLRPIEYTMLCLIHGSPGMTSAQIARSLAMSPPNMVTRVVLLEERGFVVRRACQSDRRAHTLHATQDGAHISREATRRLQEGERTLFDNLTGAERLLLGELLSKIASCRPGDS